MTAASKDKPPLHIVFIHLDLGIGGAEQLVLQLATASQDLRYNVDIVTTRCDQDHCFTSVKKPTGRLSHNVYVYGRWIPPNIFGIATAFMSTIRMLYITYQVTKQQIHKSADIIVVDVLPTSLPLLISWLSSARIIFYCHFPDKLLLRNDGNTGSRIKKWYRTILDTMEETTMNMADTLIVNSKFTLQQTRKHFQSLQKRTIYVLYPALDTSNMVQANNQQKTNISPIVSLNRFERKKNIALLIEAYAYIVKQTNNMELPSLIIAGGYDKRNIENVEYRGELGKLANEFNVNVDFRLDISDDERAILFQTALCVVYTPDKEHFGIVPLEAMYAGTPVIAVNSGGPVETILDGETGYLRGPTSKAFGDAIIELIRNPDKATKMGMAGRKHVERTFGTKRFENEWKELVEKTNNKKNITSRNATDDRPKYALWINTTLYFAEALLALCIVFLLTSILRSAGVLESSQSIIGALRAGWQGDEL